MIAALALLATSTASVSADVRVLIVPSITVTRPGEVRAVDEPARAAFDGAFREAATGTFLARRMTVVDEAETLRATHEMLGETPCATAACAHQLAVRTAATSWLVSVIVQTGDHCRARATLFDMTRGRVAMRRDIEISPCAADYLLNAAEDLARRVADGPRVPPEVSLSLTPLTLPDLEIPDLPEIDHVITSTTLRRKLTGLTPERALDVYRRNEFRTEVNDEGYAIAVRGRTPVNDCELMVAAGRGASPEERTACDGNWWELGYLAVPLGAFVMLPALAADEVSAPTVISALVLLVLGPALAITFNEDAIDAAAGEHVVSAEELSELVARSNATLRNQLGLSEAEVEVEVGR